MHSKSDLFEAIASSSLDDYVAREFAKAEPESGTPLIVDDTDDWDWMADMPDLDAQLLSQYQKQLTP